MKQIQYTEYGSPEVLHITEAETPSVRSGHILVKTAYTAVNASDARIRAARFPKGYAFPAKAMFGFSKPRNKVLGGAFSGFVEAVGTGVSDFQVGDRVCGMTGISMRCYSEYILKKTRYCTSKVPDDVTLQDACAGLFGGTSALYFLQTLGNIQKGQNILVLGASGSVGSAIVQIAAHLGAHVTGVCSTQNRELVSSLGAKEVIDYTQQDISGISHTFDCIIDTIGVYSYDTLEHLLTADGLFIPVVGSLLDGITALLPFGKYTHITSGTAPEKTEDVHYLLSLIQKHLYTPHVSAVFAYTDIAQAHKIVDSGRKVGNILIEW